MKVLIACEYSAIVRESFNQKGHDAWSCEILDSELEGNHIKGDVLKILDMGWDMCIAFTPCTYSCNSGIRWMYDKDGVINKERYMNLLYYAGMLKAILESNIKKVCCENPIPHKYAIDIIGRKYDQIIQPWQYGHGEQKSTCLWLKNLPKLNPTNIVSGRNQSMWKMSPGPERSKERSRTFFGIAKAMADQWS